MTVVFLAVILLAGYSMGIICLILYHGFREKALLIITVVLICAPAPIIYKVLGQSYRESYASKQSRFCMPIKELVKKTLFVVACWPIVINDVLELVAISYAKMESSTKIIKSKKLLNLVLNTVKTCIPA